MIDIKKSYILPILILGVLGITATSLSVVSAASASGRTSLVQKIAERFGLKQADVQAVFDQQRTEDMAQKQTIVSQRLDQAVAAGTITAAQKQLIIDKLAAVAKQRETDRTAFQTMTPEERKQAIQKEQTDLKQWATDNYLDLKSLGIGFGGFGRHGGPHFGGMAPMKPMSSNQTNPAGANLPTDTVQDGILN